MVISKKVKKYSTFVAIGLLSVALVLVIFFGERHFSKREKKIYEGCKNVMITPDYKAALKKDYL